MPTSRPFAYNTGSTISGTEQVGNLAIGTPTSGFTSTGLQWWNGPDEDLGYVIAYPQSGGTQPTPTGDFAYVQFWRTKLFTDQDFINLCNSVIKTQTFTDVVTAKNYLNTNGYWTSYVVISPTPSITPTITPSITPSITPTKTVTPTVTPSITPSITPTRTVTPTVTPSITPSITPTRTVTPTVTPTNTAYTYYRWQITESKINPPNGNCVQSSEFVFRVGGVDQSMAGVTVTNPGGSNPAGEEPSKLVDNNLTTKGLDLNFVVNGNVTNFIFQFTSAKAFNGYRWATANDEVGRDPKSWTIAGSNNGTTWTTLHTVSGFSATATRNTYQTAQTY